MVRLAAKEVATYNKGIMTLTEIRALAEEYARQYNPENLAPFPYQNVLEANADLEIYFTDIDEENVSGATLFKDDTFTIFIDIDKSPNRQHFTLGHALAHYFLHKEELRNTKGIIDSDNVLDRPNTLYSQDDDTTHRLEMEANNFAASLLMPAHLVYKAWDATESIQKCAKIFKVSPVAMSLRLASLGLVSA